MKHVLEHMRYAILRKIVTIMTDYGRGLESERLMSSEDLTLTYEEMSGTNLTAERLCSLNTSRWKEVAVREQKERGYRKLLQRDWEYNRSAFLRGLL